MKVEANILFEVNDCSIGYQWHTVCTCDLHHRGQWRYSLWTDSISKIHGSNVCLSLGYTIYRLVVLWTQITTGVGVIAILCYSPFFQYSTYQYVAAAIIIFVSTNVLEGVNMSLLAKVMSPRLSRGVFNCGLLSTEAGTLARALADGMITVAGKAGMENLLNFSMFPTLFIVVFTTVYTWIGYYTLYWA